MYTLSTYCKHGKRLVTVILAKTTSGIFNDRKTHQVIQQCYMYFGFVQFKNDFSPKPFYTLIHQNKTKIFILQSTKNTFIIMYLSSTNNNGYFFFLNWSVKRQKTLQFNSMFVVQEKITDNFVFPTTFSSTSYTLLRHFETMHILCINSVYHKHTNKPMRIVQGKKTNVQSNSMKKYYKYK